MKCKQCNSIMHITNWKPSSGMDQKLREFHCPQGHPSVYARPNAYDWKVQTVAIQAEKIRDEKAQRFRNYQAARNRGSF